MLKTCSKCNTEQSEENFRFRNKAKGSRSPWCKACFSLHEKERWRNDPNRASQNKQNNNLRRRRNRQFVYDYLKTHPCDCGESDPIVLDFDHRDGVEKMNTISDLAGFGLSLDRLKAEIEKCVVRCANCHRRRTAEQFGWYSDLDK